MWTLKEKIRGKCDFSSLTLKPVPFSPLGLGVLVYALPQCFLSKAIVEISSSLKGRLSGVRLQLTLVIQGLRIMLEDEMCHPAACAVVFEIFGGVERYSLPPN